MTTAIAALRGGIVASCQARAGSPMRDSQVIAAVAAAAIAGGACGLRIESTEHVAAVKAQVHVPVIGLVKCLDAAGTQWITPSKADAAHLVTAGADIVAIDATQRSRPGDDTSAEVIDYIHRELNRPVMADVDSIDAGVAAANAGADVVASTLAGYVSDRTPVDAGPDLGVLAGLVSRVSCPVIAEGRYSCPDHVKAAFELGAFAVVIGTAISDPEALTRTFVAAASQSSGSGAC